MKRVGLVALALGIVVACRIPDLKPFTDATAEMAAALRQGFDQTRATLASAASSADDQDAFRRQLTALDTHWAATRRAVSALVAYSDALAALAESGKQGPEVMARLTASVKDLASAIGAIPIAGMAEKVVNAVGAKVIEMQAARDLRRAVERAAEAVDIMAPILVANFADLARVHGAASRAWESRMQAPSAILMSYHQTLVAEEQRLLRLLTLIVEYQSAPARLRWRAAQARAEGRPDLAAKLEGSISVEQADLLRQLKETDSAFEAMDLTGPLAAARVEDRHAQLMDFLTSHRREIALLDPKVQQAAGELAKVQEARVRGARVLAQGGEAIGAWHRAHQSLRAVVAGQQRRPSLSELIAITRELTALAR